MSLNLHLSSNNRVFRNRREAGKLLAAKLFEYKYKSPYVLSLPRGGVVVGFEIAKTLSCPLEILGVRKIGAPGNPEFGIGAVSERGARILKNDTVGKLGITPNKLAEIIRAESAELARRVNLYRAGKPLPEFKDKTVILVDDGLATGVTARAALEYLKQNRPMKLIFAVPVCARSSALRVRNYVDSLVCLSRPSGLNSIGSFYREFKQVTDGEVIDLLNESAVMLKVTP